MLAGNEIVRAASGNKKEKKSYKLVMEMKWIFNTTLSFNKF